MRNNKMTTLRFARYAAIYVILQTVIPITTMIYGNKSYGADKSNHAKDMFQGKVEYCKDCHGLSGQGFRGYLTMPRLAGQTVTYIESQLQAFVDRKRDNNLFINMAKIHNVDSVVRVRVATYFSDLQSKPFGGGPKQLANSGKALFEEGVPEDNVPACSTCHGPDARGQDNIPRLAGQPYQYLVKELTEWNRGRGPLATPNDELAVTMQQVARNLSRAKIAAVAAYLSWRE